MINMICSAKLNLTLNNQFSTILNWKSVSASCMHNLLHNGEIFVLKKCKFCENSSSFVKILLSRKYNVGLASNCYTCMYINMH